MDDGALLPEMIIQLVEQRHDGEKALAQKVFDTNRLHEAIANGRFEGELILHTDEVKCVYDAVSGTETYCVCGVATACDCYKMGYSTSDVSESMVPARLKLAPRAKSAGWVYPDPEKNIECAANHVTDEEYYLDVTQPIAIKSHQIVRHHWVPFEHKDSGRISEFEYEVEFSLNQAMHSNITQATVKLWMIQSVLERIVCSDTHETKEIVKKVLIKYWSANVDRSDAVFRPPEGHIFKTYGYLNVAFLFHWDSFSKDHTNAFHQSHNEKYGHPQAAALVLTRQYTKNDVIPILMTSSTAKVLPEDTEDDASQSAINETSIPVRSGLRTEMIPSILSNSYNERLVDREIAGSSRFSTRWRQYRVCPIIFTDDEKESIFDFNDDTQIVTSKLAEIRDLLSRLTTVAEYSK